MPLEAIQPGATALTRTPQFAHSTAAVCVKLTMPARAAPRVAHHRHPIPHVCHDVYDATGVSVHRLRETFAGHEKSTDEVGPNNRLKALLIDRSKWGWELSTGIVYQAMNGAALCDDLRDHRFDVVFLTDVEGRVACLPTVFGNFPHDGLKLRFGASDQDCMCT